MRKFAFLLSIAIILVSCQPTKVIEKKKTDTTIKFIQGETLEEVLVRSKKEGKPVFIDFYIDRCAPCKFMDETAFTHPNVFELFNDKFINFKVDAIDFDYVDLAQKYNVQAYPTLVFLDSRGEILQEHGGGASAVKLIELAEKVIENGKVM